MGVVDVGVPARPVEPLEYADYGSGRERSTSPHRAQPLPQAQSQPPVAERAARQSVGLLKQVRVVVSAWSCMVLYGPVWSCMAGLPNPNPTSHGCCTPST